MYTSYIGKKFLKLYNEKMQQEYTAKEFFNLIQFPIFFDNEKHLMHVHGSTFFQKVSKERDTRISESEFRLNRLHTDVKCGKISASNYVGYASEKPTGVTSGQVSSINILINEDEIYASWIGAGLGLGVAGRYAMLINEDDILWRIYQGWRLYREYINNTPTLKDKEIEFWNSWWLINTLSPQFNSEHPTESLNLLHDTSMGETRISKKAWSEVVLFISRKYNSKSKFTLYAYQLDKTNTTLGFINIYLKNVETLFEWRDHVFIKKSETELTDLQIQQLSTHFSFKDACAFGTIGLKSLEPAKLRQYMPKGSARFAQGKDIKLDDESSYFNYQLFKIWIYAMLNKKEIIALADKLALILANYEADPTGDNRGKTDKKGTVKKALESRFFKEFAENITPLISAQNSTDLEEIVQNTYLDIPADNFPLFLTLVRFQYQVQQSKS